MIAHRQLPSTSHTECLNRRDGFGPLLQPLKIVLTGHMMDNGLYVSYAVSAALLGAPPYEASIACGKLHMMFFLVS